MTDNGVEQLKIRVPVPTPKGAMGIGYLTIERGSNYFNITSEGHKVLYAGLGDQVSIALETVMLQGRFLAPEARQILEHALKYTLDMI